MAGGGGEGGCSPPTLPQLRKLNNISGNLSSTTRNPSIRRIFVYNICLISKSNTVSDGVAKTLALNECKINRPEKCIEQFCVTRALKPKISQTH